MAVPNGIWFVFMFAFGCCVGSFLNVVIYRLPRDESLVRPRSSCPGCGKLIAFYDNIPLVSWLLLGGKCRNCKVAISPRYFIVELLTGLVFLAVFMVFFCTELRAGMPGFLEGGWLIYLLTITLLSAFIAASAIDLKLWIIPLSVCWLVTGAGLIGCGVGPYVIDVSVLRGYGLLPLAGAKTAAAALGAMVGLAIAFVLLATGVVKRSYESEDGQDSQENCENPDDDQINHRAEACREIVFLLPVILCSIVAQQVLPGCLWWQKFAQVPVAAGVLGSVWGYFVGCGVVWATRILGTLGFGKEAMGLGDVHLMGAAGAVIGALLVVVAFFVAPFFGLAWALFQMFFKKTRQIPYGPFLSMAVFAVIILHDRILDYWNSTVFR